MTASWLAAAPVRGDRPTRTAKEAVRAAVPCLSPVLATPAARTRLAAAADQLPLTSGAIFECHLANLDRVDLALRFRLGDGAEALARAPWPRVRTMARHWLHAADGARTHLPYIFLEFDLTGAALPVPAIFFGPGNPPDGAPPFSVVDLPVWSDLVALLRGRMVEPAARDRLLECRRRLPLRAWMGYLGLMLGRDPSGPLRVGISGIGVESLPAYLAAVGWPGSPAVLAELAAIVQRCPARLMLHLDIPGPIDPVLGVELRPECEEEWPELLAAVAHRGALAERLVGPLLSWAGMDDFAVRRLNHVKLIYRESAPPETKAYFYYGLLAGYRTPQPEPVSAGRRE